MKILITGVAGFIGSNLAEFLISLNHTVIGVDNFDPFYDRKIKQNNLNNLLSSDLFKFYENDIRSQHDIDNIFKNEIPELVVHLAAKAGVRPSIQAPMDYYDTNVMGTITLLEVMRKYNVKKMIFASSSSVYGNNKKVPFSEDDIVDFPISPYAASKKSGELICHSYHHLYDFDIFCLRFFTVYGKRQRPDLAINKFTKALLTDQEIPFYGDGSSLRDYTYIEDIVNGIHNAILNLKGYDIFNFGESKTTSLDNLIKYLEKHTNKKAKLNILPKQAGDVDKTYADITKSKRDLNYSPTTDIEEGLKKYVQYYLNSN